MSEIIKPLTGEERVARIKDIRARKGHLLGQFATHVNPLKYSILVGAVDVYQAYPLCSDYSEDAQYVYKGVPNNSLRQISSSVSEFAGVVRQLP